MLKKTRLGRETPERQREQHSSELVISLLCCMAFLVLFSVEGKEGALHLCVCIQRNTVQETAPSLSFRNLGHNSSCALLRQRNPSLRHNLQSSALHPPLPRTRCSPSSPLPSSTQARSPPFPMAGSSRAGVREGCRIFWWSPVNGVSRVPGPRAFLRSGRQLRRPFTGSTVSFSVYSFPMAIAPPSLSTSGTWPGAVLVTLKFLLQRCQI